MSSADSLHGIAISQYVLDGLLAHHFAQLVATGRESESSLAARAADPRFEEHARKAAGDAVVFSALAGTVGEDDEFVALARSQQAFVDNFFAVLRRELFTAGITAAKQRAAGSVATFALLERRQQLFHQHSPQVQELA